MSAMLPMALYGLEVPAGDVLIPALPDIPSAFRITMAAIDPSAEPESEDGATPRATLKILRQPLDYDDTDEDEDEDDFDVEEMERMLGVADDDEDDDDEDEDSEDEALNGGPSDPAKSKKARKAAAQKAIQDLLDEQDDMEVDGLTNGVNGTKKSAKALGKMPASDDSEDDEDDEDEGEWEEFVICTLDPKSHYNQPLDITIGERERVVFKVSGTHTVYLTGNYVEPAGHDHGEPGMYDPDSDEEDDYDLEPDSDELDESDDDDELDALEDPRITEVDEEEEEEAPQLVAPKDTKKDKKEKKGKNKRPAEDEEVADAETIDDLIDQAVKKDEQKLSKKQLKKQKKNDGSAVATATEAAKKEAEAPSSVKSDKKVSFAKELEQGPTPTKDAKAGAEKPKASLGVKTVQGVKIDDKKLGTGPAAKNGDRISMRYIGKLENGKVFDSNKKGKPFSFKLGAGEVIKGWEIGIQGLSAGGERRITIPAHLAYGSKGVAGIPGNSTLVFDVKLLDISKK